MDRPLPAPPAVQCRFRSEQWAGAHELMIGRAGRPAGGGGKWPERAGAAGPRRVRARPVRRRVTTTRTYSYSASCVSSTSTDQSRPRLSSPRLPPFSWRLPLCLHAHRVVAGLPVTCAVRREQCVRVSLLADGAPARFCSSLCLATVRHGAQRSWPDCDRGTAGGHPDPRPPSPIASHAHPDPDPVARRRAGHAATIRSVQTLALAGRAAHVGACKRLSRWSYPQLWVFGPRCWYMFCLKKDTQKTESRNQISIQLSSGATAGGTEGPWKEDPKFFLLIDLFRIH